MEVLDLGFVTLYVELLETGNAKTFRYLVSLNASTWSWWFKRLLRQYR